MVLHTPSKPSHTAHLSVGFVGSALSGVGTWSGSRGCLEEFDRVKANVLFGGGEVEGEGRDHGSVDTTGRGGG